MKISLMHGAGGEVMGEVISLFSKISNTNAGGIGLEALDDGAVIPVGNQQVVFTTDSHVVRPLFFPGGDIGRISVCGTINDITMMGGRPLALSCGLIVEEGFDFDILSKIVDSMDKALSEGNVSLVTGDTKVMEKGALDQIAINTAGIGVAETIIRDNGLQPGDAIIVSGTLGDHGFAVLASREEFDFADQIISDVAPLSGMVHAAMSVGTIHAMKDPTRGGFASAINEMAKKSRVMVRIVEECIPIRSSVRAASQLLGIDPLEVANEGKVVMGVPADDAETILKSLKSHQYGKDAAIIGTVTEGNGVIMETTAGGERFIEPPMGDPVPRVC
ncbi:MAG TPA: hydrogenase expression/formation protein HypE [Methanospirillum sp.]|uniref:hydrogenase expression/formation protein HypE n=1 Tax=Methanospirillum sp. TaxID=45200 RepID=UPI002B7553DC|nr:hydrogenase expression/formation protein HypE [Methanospirillum sp.]HOJ96472.1 hydrogenase expression/formation protein HypE [Methanospirillum sp.]HPP77273.1 hydrogenase expression/formation protein HypE [Methanospirillum sp.]